MWRCSHLLVFLQLDMILGIPMTHFVKEKCPIASQHFHCTQRTSLPQTCSHLPFHMFLVRYWYHTLKLWRMTTTPFSSYCLKGSQSLVCIHISCLPQAMDPSVLQALNKEKKKEIWLSPTTKPSIPTENSKTKGQYTNATKNLNYTTIADRLRTINLSSKSSKWCG